MMFHKISLKLFATSLVLLLACGEEDLSLQPKQGTVTIGGESFDLGQTVLQELNAGGDRFQVRIWDTTTSVSLDATGDLDFIRNSTNNLDILFFGVNSSVIGELAPGTYSRDFTPSDDFQFSGAEIRIGRSSGNGGQVVTTYLWESGDLEVISSSNNQVQLSWNMTFVNNTDPTDIRTSTGSFNGTFFIQPL